VRIFKCCNYLILRLVLSTYYLILIKFEFLFAGLIIKGSVHIHLTKRVEFEIKCLEVINNQIMVSGVGGVNFVLVDLVHSAQ
jgi:hypothetical protein